MQILANQITGDRRSEHSFASQMLMAFLFVSALMFGIGSLAHAAEVIEIGCGPIEKPGQYRLTMDCVVDVNGAGGISIAVDNVELDLDGHTTSGPGCNVKAPGNIIGINIRSSRVRVGNGTLKELSWGIQATGDHNHFNKLNLLENCTGIELRESNENQVSYNDISRNTVQGVLVQAPAANTSAKNNHITFNVIDENSSSFAEIGAAGLGGVVVVSPRAESNVIAFNAVSRSRQNGVILVEGAHTNIVTGNIITQSSTLLGIGINVASGSTDNFLVRNIALDNEVFDLQDSNTTCDNNIWRDNTFRTRSPGNPNSCIH